MHFTLLFKRFSLSANFKPCLEWISAIPHPDVDLLSTDDLGELRWVPHYSEPRYKQGDLVEALLHLNLDSDVDSKPEKIFLIVHESNQHAEDSDLEHLVQDCKKLTSNVQVLSPWSKNEFQN